MESFPLVFPAERYLAMVRGRYMSLLSHFSDERLEAGVAEIRQAHPGEHARVGKYTELHRHRHRRLPDHPRRGTDPLPR